MCHHRMRSIQALVLATLTLPVLALLMTYTRLTCGCLLLPEHKMQVQVVISKTPSAKQQY